MTTELESPVLDAVVTPAVDTSLIQFDVTADAIRTMQAEAAGLSIAGPDDRTGFDAVFRFRQVVKKSRVSVEKRGKELKAPHIAYNRDVDAAVKSLVEPMEAIEDGLLKQEKHYEAERERIAEEAEAARRKRYTERQNQLVEYGFKYDHNADAYTLNGVFVLVDDIRDLPDDQYAPTEELARTTYVAEFERLAEIARQEQLLADRIDTRTNAINMLEPRFNGTQYTVQGVMISLDEIRTLDDAGFMALLEQARVAHNTEQLRLARVEKEQKEAEARQREQQRLLDEQAETLRKQEEAIAAAQKKLDDEKAKAVAEEKARLKRIEDEAETERLRLFEAAQRDFQLQQEAQQAAERAAEEKAQAKADKERTKRLAPDKKALLKYLNSFSAGSAGSLTEPETIAAFEGFLKRLTAAVSQSINEVEAL